MTSTSSTTRPPPNDIAAFHTVLAQSRRILAVCGAGLSAASGLPTFRGAGGLWRNHAATELATPEAFAADPGLVWLFYGYRRHMALRAEPNAGHRALAALARKKGGDFLCLSQNVDGLHVKANHPRQHLRLLHGSLFDIKCTECAWVERDNFADPLFPAIAPASEDVADPHKPLPLLDPAVPAPQIPRSAIPRCPRCGTGLQRPGVVWFGENLDGRVLRDVDAWIAAAPVDLVLVVGTSSAVYPAAGYAEEARGPQTSVVTVNLDDAGEPAEAGDFYFSGDAAVLLPQLLEPVIGSMADDGTFQD